MAKYKRKNMVLAAYEQTADTDYGSLGTVLSGDYVGHLEAGSVVSITSAEIAASWDITADSAPLDGTDWQ